MSRSRKSVISVALTWDGARWPVRALPAKARAFLAAQSGKAAKANRSAITKLLSDDSVNEIRVCWVPRLKGGDDVLSDPFSTASGKRLAYRAVKTMRLGDMLGVVYRKSV